MNSVNGDLSYSFSSPENVVTDGKTLVDTNFPNIAGVSFSRRRTPSFIPQGQGRDLVLLQPSSSQSLKPSNRYLDLDLREEPAGRSIDLEANGSDPNMSSAK